MRRVAVLAVLVLSIGAAAVVARNVLTEAEPVTLGNAQAVPSPDQAGVVRIYVTMENGATPNRLISASSPAAQEARIAGAVSGPLVLPAGSTPSLSGDGVFIELIGFDGSMEAGRLVPIALEFEPAGTATTRALFGAPPDLHSATAAEMMIPPPDGSPELSLSVAADSAGWAVTLQTDGFTFVPDMDDPVHVPGQGHGHLYLNGLKLQRLYDHRAEIGALPPGEHSVTVTLNANTHQPYEDADGPIIAQQTIIVD